MKISIGENEKHNPIEIRDGALSVEKKPNGGKVRITSAKTMKDDMLTAKIKRQLHFLYFYMDDLHSVSYFVLLVWLRYANTNLCITNMHT